MAGSIMGGGLHSDLEGLNTEDWFLPVKPTKQEQRLNKIKRINKRIKRKSIFESLKKIIGK